MIGRIFSIEEFSTFDGPGIRTSVFFKGCPLSCKWCHNPEGQRFETEYMRNTNGCIGCGACIKAGQKTKNGVALTAQSAEVCPKNLVRKSGEEYTPEALAQKLLKNADILSSTGGGVTFSGGEPLSHADFIAACVPLLGGRLHIALQTSGFASAHTFEKTLALCDFVLYDIKLIDEAQHITYCGASNAGILRNYRTLVNSGKPFITRLPLVPTVTDTAENITSIARFLRENGVDQIEVLPYNRMAGSKYRSLLREDAPTFEGLPSRDIKEILTTFENYGIKAVKM